jgi:hypothetical protein
MFAALGSLVPISGDAGLAFRPGLEVSSRARARDAEIEGEALICIVSHWLDENISRAASTNTKQPIDLFLDGLVKVLVHSEDHVAQPVMSNDPNGVLADRMRVDATAQQRKGDSTVSRALEARLDSPTPKQRQEEALTSHVDVVERAQFEHPLRGYRGEPHT